MPEHSKAAEAIEEESAMARVLTAVKSIDAMISLPLLSLPSLGWAEYALSLPGALFGIPFYSLATMPFLIAALAEQMEVPLDGTTARMGGATELCCTVLAVQLAFWAFCCWESKQPGTNYDTAGLVRPFQPFGKKLGTITTLALPHLSVYLISLTAAKTAENAACYYTALFYFTQLVIEFFKTVVRRERPVFNQRKNLRLIHRELPQFQHILSTDHAVHSSFPSGDMSGATTFCLVCFALTPESHPSYTLLAALYLLVPSISAFGRLYFQAHFAGDVFCGALMAASLFDGWTTFFQPVTFTWSMLSYVETVVILNWAWVQKLKPKSAESQYNADELIKGTGDKMRSGLSSIGSSVTSSLFSSKLNSAVPSDDEGEGDNDVFRNRRRKMSAGGAKVTGGVRGMVRANSHKSVSTR